MTTNQEADEADDDVDTEAEFEADEAPDPDLPFKERLIEGARQTRELARVIMRGAMEHFRYAPVMTTISVVFDVATAQIGFVSAWLMALGIRNLTHIHPNTHLLDNVHGAGGYARIFEAIWPTIWPLVALTAITLFQQCLHLPRQMINQMLQERVDDEVEGRLMRHLMVVDVPMFESAEFQNQLDRVRYLDGVFQKALRLVSQLLSTVIGLVTASILLVRLSPWLLGILLLIGLPSLIVSIRANNDFESMYDEYGIKRSLSWRFKYMVQSPQSATEVRLNGAHGHLIDLAMEYGREWRRRLNRVRLRASIQYALADIGSELVRLGVNVSLMLRIFTTPGFGIAGYTFYTQIIERFESSSSQLLDSLSEGHTTALDLRAYYEILDTKPTIVSPPGGLVIPEGHIPAVEFVDVSFTYPGADKPVFKDLNLRIKAGERVALVGHNGAGKTTLINLMNRLYIPDAGVILVDGIDLAEYDLPSWHRTMGTLLQAYNRYELSARQNIEIGCIDHAGEPERLDRALVSAGATRVVGELERGLDQNLSRVYKDGTQLSGGQWQRLALARILYRDAGFIVLDEPTAAVDAKAESEIFAQLLEACAERTSIVISHRFSTVRKMDRIIFIKDGSVIEDGSHEELMAIAAGQYREMFELQAEGYK